MGAMTIGDNAIASQGEYLLSALQRVAVMAVMEPAILLVERVNNEFSLVVGVDHKHAERVDALGSKNDMGNAVNIGD